jgi:hypothetical protein
MRAKEETERHWNQMLIRLACVMVLSLYPVLATFWVCSLLLLLFFKYFCFILVVAELALLLFHNMEQLLYMCLWFLLVLGAILLNLHLLQGEMLNTKAG